MRKAVVMRWLCFVGQIAGIENWMVRLLETVSNSPWNEQRRTTFITTGMSFSARILGANSEPLYDSRLYRAFVAKRAAAGGPPLQAFIKPVYIETLLLAHRMPLSAYLAQDTSHGRDGMQRLKT